MDSLSPLPFLSDKEQISFLHYICPKVFSCRKGDIPETFYNMINTIALSVATSILPLRISQNSTVFSIPAIGVTSCKRQGNLSALLPDGACKASVGRMIRRYVDVVMIDDTPYFFNMNGENPSFTAHKKCFHNIFTLIQNLLNFVPTE